MSMRRFRHRILASTLSLALIGILLVSGVEGSDDVSQLGRIDVTPCDVALDPGDEQTFTAVGYDDQDNEIPIDPIWTATGGTITSQGLYTAGTRPGRGSHLG